jgi:heme/copper-type cytochrome/quinol oxidase subunit 4
VIFAVIAIPIGLAYIVRNILLFGEKPGIPSPALIPNESVMFTGDYSVWSIIGIPSIWDLHVEFPFHPLSAKAIHNTWVILFQTGLFAEAFPTEINDYLLSFAQIAYVASILLATVTTVVFIVSYFIKLRQNQSMRLKTTFLLFTYIFMLVSFGLYVFKYPYTCSSDFRYMTASLVFTSLGFVVVNEGFDGMFTRWVKYITNFAMAMTLICSMIVYMFWDLH